MLDQLQKANRGIIGNVGKEILYGHNQYGPWKSTKTWTPEQWEGLDGPRVDAVILLASTWQGMSQFEKNSWTKNALRTKLPNYTAYCKYNMPR